MLVKKNHICFLVNANTKYTLTTLNQMTIHSDFDKHVARLQNEIRSVLRTNITKNKAYLGRQTCQGSHIPL